MRPVRGPAAGGVEVDGLEPAAGRVDAFIASALDARIRALCVYFTRGALLGRGDALRSGQCFGFGRVEPEALHRRHESGKLVGDAS